LSTRFTVPRCRTCKPVRPGRFGSIRRVKRPSLSASACTLGLMGPQEMRQVFVRPAPLVAVGLSAGWTAAAFLAGGFFSPTVGALALAAGAALVLLAALHGLRRPSVGVVALGFLALWTASSFLWGASNAGDAALLPLGYSATLWLAEQSDQRWLVRALRIALLLVSGAALIARLLALGPTAAETSHRLQWPVTYSNGLGVVAATGLLVWLLLPTRVPALGWVAATVCGATTLLTFSRGVAAGLAVALILYAVLSGRVPRRALIAGATIAAATALLVGPAAMTSFGAPSPDRRDASRLLSLSGHGRVGIWHQAWREAVSSPLAGIGPGNFRTITGGSSAHSLELQTFVDLGLVGLLALAVFLLGGLRAVRGSPVSAGVFALWLVVASVDWIWQLPACTVPALIAVGGTVRPRA
jgi:hypothetical protein